MKLCFIPWMLDLLSIVTGTGGQFISEATATPICLPRLGKEHL